MFVDPYQGVDVAAEAARRVGDAQRRIDQTGGSIKFPDPAPGNKIHLERLISHIRQLERTTSMKIVTLNLGEENLQATILIKNTTLKFSPSDVIFIKNLATEYFQEFLMKINSDVFLPASRTLNFDIRAELIELDQQS